MQKHAISGSFIYGDSTNCLPKDSSSRPCLLQQENLNGSYGDFSWEYSLFAPHDTAWLIEAMGGNKMFVADLTISSTMNIFFRGEEPSLQV